MSWLIKMSDDEAAKRLYGLIASLGGAALIVLTVAPMILWPSPPIAVLFLGLALGGAVIVIAGLCLTFQQKKLHWRSEPQGFCMALLRLGFLALAVACLAGCCLATKYGPMSDPYSEWGQWGLVFWMCLIFYIIALCSATYRNKLCPCYTSQ